MTARDLQDRSLLSATSHSPRAGPATHDDKDGWLGRRALHLAGGVFPWPSWATGVGAGVGAGVVAERRGCTSPWGQPRRQRRVRGLESVRFPRLSLRHSRELPPRTHGARAAGGVSSPGVNGSRRHTGATHAAGRRVTGVGSVRLSVAAVT
jgi:hypothetical protein